MGRIQNTVHGCPVMTRRRARLDEEVISGENPFLLNPNDIPGPRDIFIEEEAMVKIKIEVKEEPDQEEGLGLQQVTQEIEPARKRIKVEDLVEMVVVKDEFDLPVNSRNVNEDHEQANADARRLKEVDDAGVDDGRHVAPFSGPYEGPSTSSSAVFQTEVRNDRGDHHDASQTKVLERFLKVINVNLDYRHRQAFKTWREGIGKVVQGEHTLQNAHPTVIIPHGDVDKTVRIVNQVLEAYKNVDLTVCRFPPRVLKIRDENTTQTAQQIMLSRATILKFINKFGSGLKEFKYNGIMGANTLYQYNSAADWYLTVVGEWIGRMPNLEKLTMRNSLDCDLFNCYALYRVQELSDQLASYPMFPKLRKLKSLEEYLIPFSVISRALLVNSKVLHVHSYSKTEMCAKLRIQEKRRNVQDVSFFLHLNRYDPSSI